MNLFLIHFPLYVPDCSVCSECSKIVSETSQVGSSAGTLYFNATVFKCRRLWNHKWSSTFLSGLDCFIPTCKHEPTARCYRMISSLPSSYAPTRHTNKYTKCFFTVLPACSPTVFRSWYDIRWLWSSLVRATFKTLLFKHWPAVICHLISCTIYWTFPHWRKKQTNFPTQRSSVISNSQTPTGFLKHTNASFHGAGEYNTGN